MSLGLEIWGICSKLAISKTQLKLFFDIPSKYAINNPKLRLKTGKNVELGVQILVQKVE